MAKINTSTLFLTKTVEKRYSLGYAHTYIFYGMEKRGSITVGLSWDMSENIKVVNEKFKL